MGAGVLVAMMLVITTDVCLRYFFNRSILGTYEIVSYMMVVIVGLGIAHTAVEKGHINVDLVVSRFPPGTQAIIESIVTLVGCILFCFIAWQSVIQAKTQQLAGTTSEVLGVPVYPFVWVVFAGSAVLTAVLLYQFAESLSRATRENRHPWIYFLPGTLFVLLVGVVL